jgi:SAM-dependent methyltransferase
MNCRHCGTPLKHTFLDLGYAPPSNAYLIEADLSRPEKHYPLKIKVCDQCWLVQTEDYAQVDELFSPDYAYFSSTSTGWLEHASNFADKITRELSLDDDSFVIEVACNDGYLLKNFVIANIPCLGIEPTASTALAAEELGIPVLGEFFGESLGKRLASQGKQADLIVGNNVYAHVPDINDFTRGFKAALKPTGTITLEFPHLLRLIEYNQFDTVYHEHFSYLSLHSVSRIFAEAGLRVWKVEELSTHGGSLRVFGCHADDPRTVEMSVTYILDNEKEAGLQSIETYLQYQPCANKVKNDLLAFLIEQANSGKKVVAYGAAAKGNTMMNFAGIRNDLIAYVVDRSPSKQNKYMPGSHIPIVEESVISQTKPDYIVILPWNIKKEVMEQLHYVKAWGGRFVTSIPRLTVV